MTAEKMMELADEIETRRGKDLYMMQPDRDLVVAALRASAVGAGAREALEKAVRHVLNLGHWPESKTEDDRGLEADEYVEFVTEVITTLQSEPVQPADVNDTIPCYKGGHKCNWPACLSDCDGRPGLPVRPEAPAGVWQPIETAPRDGADVLLVDGDDPAMKVIAFWQGGAWLVAWDHQDFNSPTHWMPLPSDPVRRSTQQGGDK